MESVRIILKLSVSSAYWKREGGENPLFFLPTFKADEKLATRVQGLPATFLLPPVCGTHCLSLNLYL